MRSFYNGNGNERENTKYLNLNDIVTERYTESEERAIIASLYAPLVEEYPQRLKNLLAVIENYELKPQHFSMDYTRDAFKALMDFTRTHDEGKWNWATFREWCERNGHREDFETLRDLYDYDEAVGEEVFKFAVQIVKEFAVRRELWLKTLSLVADKKPDIEELFENLQKILEEAKREIEVLRSSKEEAKNSEIEELFLTIEDIENVKVDWLVQDFIPKNAITGITAKFATGKTTLVYGLLKTYILGHGHKVLYVDLDNPLTVIKKKLEDFGLREFVEKGELKILSRHKIGINARHEAWRKVKDWLLNQSEHFVVIIDSLKNFAKGYDINSDKEAEFLMSELKDLTAKHTVIYLHHIPKMLNPDMPFKNSGTILDNTDVAFFLETKKEARTFKLTRFKDRIPVKDKLEFYLGEDGTLEKALPEHLREAIRFVKAVFEEVEKGNNKKKALAKAVSEITGIGVNRCETLLEHYAGRYWEIKHGEHNAKIIEPIKSLEEAIKDLESRAYAKPVENQEVHGSKNTQTAEALENQELHSCMDIYNNRTSNYTPESDTLKFEEEIKAIQETLSTLLEDDEYVDLEVMKVYAPDREVAKDIAQDETLKSILLELYILREEGDLKGWEFLVEEVKEGKKSFSKALKEFRDMKDIDF
ncbi:hypothetical protein JCM9492_11270 [Aquifex pyrophilus]